MTVENLTPQQAAVLAFARRLRYGVSIDKAAADIPDLFGMSANRYHQVLNEVIDLPAALISDPVLVKRLRRQRDGLRAARSRQSIQRTAS